MAKLPLLPKTRQQFEVYHGCKIEGRRHNRPAHSAETFHWLSEAFADEDLRSRLIQAGQQLDTSPISDLLELLAQVRPTAAYPTTHPGIQ